MKYIHKHIELKDIPPELQSLYGELLDRIDYHIDITRKRTRIFWHISYIMRLGPPLLSAAVTAAFIKEFSHVAAGISVAVTIATTLSSILRPYESLLFLEKYSAKFWEFHTDMQLAMEKANISAKNDHDRSELCLKELEKNNAALSDLIEDFNRGPNLKGQHLPRKQKKETE